MALMFRVQTYLRRTRYIHTNIQQRVWEIWLGIFGVFDFFLIHNRTTNYLADTCGTVSGYTCVYVVYPKGVTDGSL